MKAVTLVAAALLLICWNANVLHNSEQHTSIDAHLVPPPHPPTYILKDRPRRYACTRKPGQAGGAFTSTSGSVEGQSCCATSQAVSECSQDLLHLISYEAPSQSTRPKHRARVFVGTNLMCGTSRVPWRSKGNKTKDFHSKIIYFRTWWGFWNDERLKQVEGVQIFRPSDWPWQINKDNSPLRIIFVPWTLIP